MKKLADIFKNIEVQEWNGPKDITISDISFDSRQVKSGQLFIAIKGTAVDGHKFITAAIDKGARVIVCEVMPEKPDEKITYIKVKNPARALGFLASNFYENPSEKIQLIGITGTNGKTTAATLLYKLFQKLGYKSGLLSTVRNYIINKAIAATHTTPDALQINRILKEMVDAGCKYAFMEVSSHSVVQERIAGLAFRGGIFTNISHDHLDYHKTFGEYLRAKKSFFDGLLPGSFALINSDDRNSKVMIQNTRAVKKFYGIRTMADFKAKIIESHFDGMLINMDQVEVWTKLIGEFNAYNLLSVYGCARLLNQPKDEILKILSTLDVIEGRFEHLKSNNGVIAIVDYAHTPDAVLNVLKAINQIRTGNEQLITVIGAGGDRDKTKRPTMAKIAVENSDKTILTSDNPRNENPEDIINDMYKGVGNSFRKNVSIIVDRKEAIKTACMIAGSGDIILVAGKGHENYQEIKGKRYHFNDKEIIAEQFMLNNLNLQ
ncbi:MAG: UDP-N-acetylmuramoyl-L-alanyl-D-glutamate--2,6-diaminopimelate ligase [Bacteroidales bacterium]|nr:MAG: UDP-N-acetylmuramoyl-L-alanyl-D-glutamate--2,6-diaminopimelate ligase [Bacteroidales bacterium]